MATCTAAASGGDVERKEMNSSMLLKPVQPLVSRFSVFSPLQLQANVDLNLPPPNWLRSSSPATAFTHAHFTSHSEATGEPSSTALASHYPHIVGDVDVISDSQNIKKLLKLPYCPSPVSMAIHRVGETLLIDEFAAPMNLPTGISASLDKVFEGSMLQLWFTTRKKRPALTRHRNMFSKLLYYSLADRALPPATDSTEDKGPHHTPSSIVGAASEVTMDVVSSGRSSGDVSTASPSDQCEDNSSAQCEDNASAQCEDNSSAQCEDSRTKVSTVPAQLEDRMTGLRVASQLEDGTTEANLSAQLEDRSTESAQLEDSTDVQRNRELFSAAVNDDQVDVGRGGERGMSTPMKTTPHGDIVAPHLVTNEGAGDERGNDCFSGGIQSLHPATARVGMTSVKRVGREVGEIGDERTVKMEGRGEETRERRRGDIPFPYSPPLPKPRPFHHDVQWEIADIRMLLGSDLPIFGRDSHPAISLRLRDMERPITVLTGLDYWLDNLMCNVPELAMCFHLDGVVQRYKTVKTEDIPNLENSEFSPREVLEVAQNILAFLKANCTREGHTYWLFRRREEEVVKLYDITSLMEITTPEEERGQNQNPFARSVAVLFYRVARNMLTTPSNPPLSGEELNMAKLLLENCVRLLRESNHIDNINISSSACYLLAELYLNRSPQRTYSTSPDHRADITARSRDTRDDIIHTRSCDRKLSVNSEEDLDEEEEEDVGISATCLSSLDSESLSVNALRQGPQTFPDDPTHPLPPLLLGCSRDRARLALNSVAKGIAILGESLSPPPTDAPLAQTCGSHLLQKAGSAYLSLAVACTKTNKYGRGLQYTRYALLCFRSSKCVGSAVEEPLDHFLSWQQCGDLHCLISVKSCSTDFEDFRLENPEDTPIITAATRLHLPITESKEEACLTIHSNRETSLWRSIDCYEKALQLAPSVPSLDTASDSYKTLESHFASAWNELGTYYMHVSSSLDYTQEKEKMEKLWTCSYSCLNRALDLYSAEDGTTALNRAITYANMGCLTRACASIHTRLAEAEGAEFNADEKTYYEKSLQYYITAQQLVRRHQSVDPEFWSSLVCDLVLVYNTTARHMMDRPPLSNLSPPEVERKVIDTLMKSLHCTEPLLSVVDRNSPRYQLVHQLAGESHHRLASLYHKSAFSSSSSVQKQRHSRSLAEKHYNKAYQYYLPEYHARDVLRLLLEKATLFELQAHGQGVKHQMKLLKSALSSLLECDSILQYYQPQSKPTEIDRETEHRGKERDTYSDVDKESGREREGGGDDNLVTLVLSRLLGVLKQLVSAALKRGDQAKPETYYKSMYAVALRASQSDSSTISEQTERARNCLRTVALTKGD